jgi:conjugative relaxase-like TrwC/TraI family protein
VGGEKIAQTGNLLVALFQHDTNRNQEPNAHIHAVVANVTQGPDGKWRALE